MRFFLAAVMLAGAVVVAAMMISSRPEPPRREVPVPIPIAVTEPALAGAGAIPVHGSGTVRPRAQIDITAEISGRVVWVEPAFESGGRIGRGQALFRLDDAHHRHRVEQVRADVAVQEVELLKVQEEARLARSQYEQFQRRREGEPLPDSGPLTLWEPQIAAAQATVDRERAALAEAQLVLSRNAVHAPFAGIVRAASLEVGQFVVAGQPVGQIYAADAVEVVVPLADADAALIPGLWELRAGDADRRIAARVVADYGATRHAWVGYVDRVEATLDARTRTLDVIVRVPDPLSGGVRVAAGDGPAGAAASAAGGPPSPPLLVGKFVDVEIQGRTPDTYFKVRRAALRPGNEIWAVRDGALTIVGADVLQRADDVVYVTADLEPEQPVIVGGIRIATEGMAVRMLAGGDR